MTTIALVTGANKGLGRETVRRLAALGWDVYLTARDEARGSAAAAELDVRFAPLDVTSDASVAAAADTVRRQAGRLDVLINNAGIGTPDIAVGDTRAADLRAVLDVNVLGPVRVTNAFLPLLRAAEHPRIVMVSSTLGSIDFTGRPHVRAAVPPQLGYPAAKAALNMITVQYARALDGIQVNAVEPGFTATDLTGHRGHQTVTEGTDVIIRLATIGPSGPTAGFFDRAGDVPW
ncbi:SDR family NAD(P)-dependent oxidoreductase [Actinoplanes sp. M2I2]|uniref:SDR family NAD(P)-dependent oxidoreductase n=1 Tax=Actinoplanes sp. M2I2 TaxID=1734444 RepID=UPI0020221758|nr:SDR family NAD(P)-dependent oxidoreductase [Actinoplanes sp. M2I2]